MKLIDADALRNHMYHEAFETDSGLQKWESGLWIRYQMFEEILNTEITVDAEPIVRCKDCKHRFLEIIEGEKVFSCLYRMGTLDLNGYCDCGAKLKAVT